MYTGEHCDVNALKEGDRDLLDRLVGVVLDGHVHRDLVAVVVQLTVQGGLQLKLT